jgi:hypothetical protein
VVKQPFIFHKIKKLSAMLQNPHVLEESPNSLIIALSDTEVGKIILPPKFTLVNAATGEPIGNIFGDPPTLQKEINALKFANTINDLMPRFIREQTWQTEDGIDHDMMVMERLYPLPYNHFDVPIRTTMIELFELQLKQLHDNDFVHGDLLRPTSYFTRGDKDWMLKNVVQTENRLRLIDAGFGKMYSKEKGKSFFRCMIQEQYEFADLKTLYLSY